MQSNFAARKKREGGTFTHKHSLSLPPSRAPRIWGSEGGGRHAPLAPERVRSLTHSHSRTLTHTSLTLLRSGILVEMGSGERGRHAPLAAERVRSDPRDFKTKQT